MPPSQNMQPSTRILQSTTRPAPQRTDGSNAFARHSMVVRLPDIIQDVRAHNADYAPRIHDALQRLHDAIHGDEPLVLFDAPAPDYDLWAKLFEPHAASTWLDSDWFFAEMLAYRNLLDATDYWATLRDPFAPDKEAEVASAVLWETLGAALDVSGPIEQRLQHLLIGALWGNRIDLSIKSVAAQGTAASDDHLLVNETSAVIEHLLQHAPSEVHLVMDNAGTEQAMDVAVGDALLATQVASRVTLHVKMQPVLVSDVIVADMHRLLDALLRKGGTYWTLATRFSRALADGRVRIVPDFFWNTDGRLWELPPRLAQSFSDASLVILKGDANYRRATNDAIWPAEATLVDAIQHFPAPLLALRTLKCDTLVGVDAQTQAQLDAQHGDDWRHNGTYGVAQFARFPVEDV